MPSACKRFGGGNRISRALMIFALMSFQAYQLASAQALAIHDLGTLSGGDYSSAAAVNNRGDVVGRSRTVVNANIEHAFLYRQGTMTDLGTLQGGDSSFARGINDRGQIVGGAPAGPLLRHGQATHAFLYDGGVMTDLGTSTYAGSEAFGVNQHGHGQVVGTLYVGIRGEGHAFLYENGRINDLGSLPDNPFYFDSYGAAINNRGQVVGTAGLRIHVHEPPHAFLYENGVMKDLGTLSGDKYSYGNAINDSGEVVGESRDAADHVHAFLYQKGIMTSLGTLPGGSYSTASGINNRGQVVGTADNGHGEVHGFLYENGVMTDLGVLPGGNSSSAFGSTSAATWWAKQRPRAGRRTLSCGADRRIMRLSHVQSPHCSGALSTWRLQVPLGENVNDPVRLQTDSGRHW